MKTVQILISRKGDDIYKVIMMNSKEVTHVVYAHYNNIGSIIRHELASGMEITKDV